MPKCHNCSKYYTGKENTPLGKGYSASVEKVGKKMKGRDGKMYVVKPYGKNGKRWMRVSSSKRRKTSPRGYLDPNEIENFLNEADEKCPGMKDILNSISKNESGESVIFEKFRKEDNGWLRKKFLNKLDENCSPRVVFKQMIGMDDTDDYLTEDKQEEFYDDWVHIDD